MYVLIVLYRIYEIVLLKIDWGFGISKCLYLDGTFEVSEEMQLSCSFFVHININTHASSYILVLYLLLLVLYSFQFM